MFSLAAFTSRDGVAEADRAQYNQLTASFEADLRPSGALEICLAAEILRATWRSQRYAAVNDADLPDDAARTDLSRARASAARSLRWGMSELQKLQTNREIQLKLGINLPGIADIRQVLKFTGSHLRATAQPAETPESANSAKRNHFEEVANLEPTPEAQIPDTQKDEPKSFDGTVAEFTERTQLIPRSSPCPCGSGEKYKRCCGKDAPPVPGDWLKSLKDAA
jgi:hypothetical protein